MLLRTALSLIAASLSILATAGEAGADASRVVRGPWQWRSADGSPHLACAVAGAPTPPKTVQVDGRDVPAQATVTDLPGSNDGADRVLVLHLPLGTHGEAVWRVDGAPLEATIPPLPAPSATVRIALASGRAWPDRAAIAELARHLDGPPQLVLVLGPGAVPRLGTGGWEHTLPIVVVAPPEPALAAATAGEDARWRHGLSLGILGLPASPDRPRADLAMARDLSPWLVYLDAPAGWDPSTTSHVPGSPEAIGPLISSCQRLSVPLILGSGSAGLISEPLVLADGGAVHTAAGGVRYVLPLPAADAALNRLPDEIALPLEQPLLAGLRADLNQLDLLLARPGDERALRLGWTRGGDPGPATGSGETAALATQLANAESLDSPEAREALERLLWLPRDALTSGAPFGEALARLRDEGGPAGRALVRRLAPVNGDNPEIPPLPGDPDPAAERDLLLWRIAHVRGNDAISWRDQAARSPDPLVLRALLNDIAHDPNRELLPVLVRRVQMLAADELPLDPDPLDQHRLLVAVFDEVRLSPTPLRPLAVALRERVAALARGPIDRFIARHGEMRPPR